MYIWGKQYFLVFKPDNQKNSFEIQNQNIVLSMSAKSTVKQRDAYVKEEYRKILKEEIEKRLPKWEAQTGLKCDSWQTKYMVTKWGACSTGKKKLWFNLQLAQHSELVSVEGRLFKLRLANDQRHLLQINRSGPEKLQEALSAHFGFPVRVAIEVGEIATVTPAQRNQAEKTERHAAAVVALEQDPFVRELIARFDATLEVASVKPL